MYLCLSVPFKAHMYHVCQVTPIIYSSLALLVVLLYAWYAHLLVIRGLILSLPDACMHVASCCFQSWCACTLQMGLLSTLWPSLGQAARFWFCMCYIIALFHASVLLGVL